VTVPTRPASRPPTAWDRFFFEPESPSPIVLVRIAWGIAVALWGLTMLPDVNPFLTKGDLRYDKPRGAGSWNPLDWIGWSKAPLVVCVLLVVAAVAVVVGYRSRLSTVVATLCLLSLERTNPAIFNSGDLLLRQIGVCLSLAPSGLLLSWDAWRARRSARGAHAPPPRRAPWATRLLQLELAVGYLLSCWAKLRGQTWHNGTALALALRISDLHRFTVPSSVFHQSTALNLLTWATLLFEGSFLFLIWPRSTRMWVLGAGIFFHLGIDLFFDVGFFSWAIWIAYLAFLPPDVADRVVAWLDRTVVRRGAEPSGPTVLLPPEPAQ
jgi:vitamin K-dependent gamma-carboxylase-like protein